MIFPKLLYNKSQQLRTLWKIVIFTILLIIAVLPLLFISNKTIQFLGALFVLILGLKLNSKFLDKREFSDYGLVLSSRTFRLLAVGSLIGFCTVVLLVILGNSLNWISVSKVISASSQSLLALFAFKMLLVAIIEETFFRGYLFTSLIEVFKKKKSSNRQSIIFALVLSSTCFGLAHLGNSNASFFSITALTINGMVWCIPFILTKNLGLSIGLHTTWNLAQTYFGFTMSGNSAHNPLFKIENVGADFLTGGDYGPEAGMLGLMGFGIMFLLTLLYLRFFDMKISYRLYN